MANDLVNGWQYRLENAGVISAVDPNGQQHSFSDWTAFWRAAHGQAATPGVGRTVAWIVGGGVFFVILIFFLAHDTHQSPPAPREPEVAAGRGEDMVANLGCSGKWSDDKKNAIFDADYKDRLTTVTGTISTVGSGEVNLKVLPSTLTSDVHLKMANASDTYDLVKDQTITIRFVPTTIGGCFLGFRGKDGVIVSK
jgi:hypothetical protein